jgi:hypothetical protein
MVIENKRFQVSGVWCQISGTKRKDTKTEFLIVAIPKF